MRAKFFSEPEIGIPQVEAIKIPIKKRDGIYKVLRGLQHLYMQKEALEKIFTILEAKIELKQKGAPGMSLWEILVIGVIKLTNDFDYDKLDHTVNQDELVREMLMINRFGAKRKEYGTQTLKDNVKLLDEGILKQINEIIVGQGHELKKKEEEEESEQIPLAVKTDSYVVETNVHFPTDYGLLWDSLRKGLDETKRIMVITGERRGWRKINYIRKKIKNLDERIVRCSRRGGKNKEKDLKALVREYLQASSEVLEKFKRYRVENKTKADIWEKWEYYVIMLEKHIDLTDRRILGGEQIPHIEKVFSIFEPHTEWVNKGKSNNRVELGIKTSIATDQYGLILSHRVMQKEQDVDAAGKIITGLLKIYKIKSVSFDKGYWSKENYEEIKGKITTVVMPKKGRRNKDENQREHEPEFIKLRKKHSSVESEINALEHQGVSKCRDRGIEGFRRLVALGVVAYNLHKIGGFLLERDRLQNLAA